MWTKRQIVTQAFEEIGLAEYVYDLSPEQLDSGLRKLDAMMATWNAKGIRVGYPIPTDADASNLSDETGVPDSAYEAMYLNLAIRIAPGFGKTVMPETKISAHAAYNALRARFSTPPKRVMGPMVSGAGNKRYTQRPFVTGGPDDLGAGPDGVIELE